MGQTVTNAGGQDWHREAQGVGGARGGGAFDAKRRGISPVGGLEERMAAQPTGWCRFMCNARVAAGRAVWRCTEAAVNRALLRRHPRQGQRQDPIVCGFCNLDRRRKGQGWWAAARRQEMPKGCVVDHEGTLERGTRGALRAHAKDGSATTQRATARSEPRRAQGLGPCRHLTRTARRRVDGTGATATDLRFDQRNARVRCRSQGGRYNDFFAAKSRVMPTSSGRPSEGRRR